MPHGGLSVAGSIWAGQDEGRLFPAIIFFGCSFDGDLAGMVGKREGGPPKYSGERVYLEDELKSLDRRYGKADPSLTTPKLRPKHKSLFGPRELRLGPHSLRMTPRSFEEIQDDTLSWRDLVRGQKRRAPAEADALSSLAECAFYLLVCDVPVASSTAAWAAARRAVSRRKGEQET